MSRKPSLSKDLLQEIVFREFSPFAETLKQLVEGEESQAFSFKEKNEEYVLRVHISAEGFKKDAYCFQKFVSEKIPIPEVLKVGSVDSDHSFCISKKIPGVTLQESSEEAIDKLLVPTDVVLSAIHGTDISSTSGFGDFDSAGKGKYSNWRDFLTAALEPENNQWDDVRKQSDSKLIDDIMREFVSLLSYCPEERQLLHADFGSNNVLTDGIRITGVLDWEEAKYGDPLFDMGEFWSTWLMCVRKQSEYWQKTKSGLPYYQERKRCYDLRTALVEIYENALGGGTEMLRWVENRSKEILRS